LARDGSQLENNAGNAYYVGKKYGNAHPNGLPYAPPSQPLIGTSGLSQTIKFSSPPPFATTKPASVGIDEVGGGSATDLLGRSDLQSSMPIPETHNGVFASDSWLSPISSAGSYSGGFA